MERITSPELSSTKAPHRLNSNLSTDFNFSLEDILVTQKLIKPFINKTPIIHSEAPSCSQLLYKCEILQPTRSFKIRSAFSAILRIKNNNIALWNRIQENGIITCSSGNFGSALALVCRLFNIPYEVLISPSTTLTKINILRIINPNTKITEISAPEWQNTMVKGNYKKDNKIYISGQQTNSVLTANATIIHEVLEEYKDIYAVVTPYGGGSLTLATLIYLKKYYPNIKLYTAEGTHGAPFYQSYHKSKPTYTNYETNPYIDGIGSSFVIPPIFEYIKQGITSPIVSTPEEIKNAILFTAKFDKLIIEGAAAATIAAAHKIQKNTTKNNKILCILTGGNIDYNLITLIGENQKNDFKH